MLDALESPPDDRTRQRVGAEMLADQVAERGLTARSRLHRPLEEPLEERRERATPAPIGRA